MDYLDELEGYYGLKPSRQPQVQPFDPREAESLMQGIGHKALGSVSWVGQSLGKALGGRAIRGLLGGKPEELLSAIPFSDTMGITREDNQVTGEDLLRKWGLLQGEGEKGKFEMRDLAGPLAEIALDPATYATFGASALTKAGKLAKLGQGGQKLAATTAERIAAGQGGLMGLRLPFTELETALGTGPLAEKIARAPGKLLNKGLDKMGVYGDAVRGAGRVWNGLFDPTVSFGGRTATSAEGQALNRTLNERVPAAQADALARWKEIARPYAEGDKIGAASRDPHLANAVENPNAMGPFLSNQTPETARAMADQTARMVQEDAKRGVFYPERENYLHRQKTLTPEDRLGFGREALSTKTRDQLKRLESIGDVDKEVINAAGKDPNVSGPVRKLLNPANPKDLAREREYVEETFFDFGNKERNRMAQLERMAPPAGHPLADELAALKQTQKQAKGLTGFVANLTPEYAEADRPFFGHNPMTDLGTKMMDQARRNEVLDSTFDHIAKTAGAEGTVGDGSMRVGDLLKKMGLRTREVQPGVYQGAAQEIADRLGQAGQSLSLKEVKNLHVPAGLANELTKVGRSFTTPEVLRPVIQAIDSITNMTKAGQTVISPSFHARNLPTGVFQNWVKGLKDPFVSDPVSAIAKPFIDAEAVLRGDKAVKGLNKIPGWQHLTDEQATLKLHDLIHEWDVKPTFGESRSAEVFGKGDHARAAQGLNLPGAHPDQESLLNLINPVSAAKKAFFGGKVAGEPTSLNPLKIAGTWGNNTTTFGPVAAGQELGHAVDSVNRVSAMIAALKQGYSPEAASAISKATHYDYKALTPFEKTVMRRVVPFYNWARHNVPFVLDQIAQQPGGNMANAIKMTSSLRAQQGFIPEYIGEGLAVPLGQEDDGKQRFLTHFGMPFEDAFNELSPGARPVKRSAQKVLSQVNPLLKAPLEMASGTQFYSGREMDDLSSKGLTGVPLIDQAIMNGPVSRIDTMGRTLLDERKGIGAKAVNLLSPGKLTDVNMEQQRGVAVRNYLEDLLRQNPDIHKFTQLSVKPEDLAKLSPDELEAFRLYRTMQAAAQQRARDQQKSGKIVGVKRTVAP